MVTIEEMSGEVFPSNLRCALRVNVPVDEPEEALRAGRSLSEYMRLPVDQYVGIDLPMGAEMKRVPGDRDMFQLEIPGLKFLSLEVKPVVRVRVRLVKDGESVETWTGQSGFPGGKTPEWRAAEAREIAQRAEEARAKRAACEDDDAPDVPEECDAPAPPPPRMTIRPAWTTTRSRARRLSGAPSARTWTCEARACSSKPSPAASRGTSSRSWA